MNTLVFVYGTLKRGHCNAHYLNTQTFVSEALTTPHYRMVDCGGYPGLYHCPNNGLSIHGEIWQIDPITRTELDRLEDLDIGLYTFEPIQLLEPFASPSQPIYAYFFHLPTSKLPDAGNHWPIDR